MSLISDRIKSLEENSKTIGSIGEICFCRTTRKCSFQRVCSVGEAGSYTSHNATQFPLSLFVECCQFVMQVPISKPKVRSR